MWDALQNLNFLHLFYFWVVASEGSVAAASKALGVAQPTISMQIRKLEVALGQKLFDRAGRGLVLTEFGRTVQGYAEDIFSLGRELLGSARGGPTARLPRLYVGVPNELPKLVTYRLLEPVLHMPDHIQIVCREAELEKLAAELALHQFDVILSDSPILPNVRVKTYNHLLGDCGIAICGTPDLVERYRPRFPKSLHRAPFLLPAVNTEMRRAIDRWFDSQNLSPHIIGEFDDCALLKEFGHAGAGLFPVPAAVLREVKRQYAVRPVGRLENVRMRFYAITTERRLTHPAVMAISEAAKRGLLKPKPHSGRNGVAATVRS